MKPKPVKFLFPKATLAMILVLAKGLKTFLWLMLTVASLPLHLLLIRAGFQGFREEGRSGGRKVFVYKPFKFSIAFRR